MAFTFLQGQSSWTNNGSETWTPMQQYFSTEHWSTKKILIYFGELARSNYLETHKPTICCLNETKRQLDKDFAAIVVINLLSMYVCVYVCMYVRLYYFS